MVRKAFYSFHYKEDSWRASKVRNMGVVEGNRPASDHAWESIEKGGDSKIQKWIDDELYGKSVLVVLIGEHTAGRKWIKYEINKAWTDGKGVLGVHIHKLENHAGDQSNEGSNPFDAFKVGGKSMSSIVKAYDPPFASSTYAYDHIKENLADWIETAIAIRAKY